MRTVVEHLCRYFRAAAIVAVAVALVWRGYVWDDPTGISLLPSAFCVLMALCMMLALLTCDGDKGLSADHGSPREPAIPVPQPVHVRHGPYARSRRRRTV